MKVMTLRTHPKMTWQGQPVWNPASWAWMTTLQVEANCSIDGIEKFGRLISVRPFNEKNGNGAIEILVGFERAVFSAVIRLDDPAAIPDLMRILDSLHGSCLKEIGNIELARFTSRIVAKPRITEPQIS
jgi:hypothetical protein